MISRPSGLTEGYFYGKMGVSGIDFPMDISYNFIIRNNMGEPHMNWKKIQKTDITDMVTILALLMVGSFHEYISCLLSVILCVCLLIRIWKAKTFAFKQDMNAISVILISLGYGLTCFWAVDRGMAFIGFLKFLPLLLFMLLLWQESGKKRVLTVLPYLGAAMAVISAVGMHIPGGDQWFSVAGRLAGFFQYPNTFAVFLLVCELLLLKKPQKPWYDYVILILLVAGLLYTGSRTVFVLFLVLNFAMLLVLFPKKGKAALLAAAGVAALVVGLLALAGNPVISRYLSISLTESTFVGRILYFVDALPLLLKYPFGMGYMGYYYIQGSIQTGVYSVAYIHNDFLQLLLDIGWIPGLVFIGSIVSYFVQKNIPLADKLVVAALCLHSLFDFNLQMVGMFFVLLLLLDRPDTKLQTIKVKPLGKAALAGIAAVSLYMGVALCLSHLGHWQVSDQLYAYNTRNKLSMLEQETDLEKANALADEILAYNTQYFAPYSIKSKYSYSKGDFTSVIQNKQAAFQRNPFEYREYEEYCQMLLTGIELYRKAGDTQSADFCIEQLQQTQKMLTANADRLSSLGKMIDDQPVTELSESLQQQIQKIGGSE